MGQLFYFLFDRQNAITTHYFKHIVSVLYLDRGCKRDWGRGLLLAEQQPNRCSTQSDWAWFAKLN